MNNEPVAWMEENQKALAWVKEALINPIPLYTHPAKTQADIEYETDKAYWRTRTLTDKEIIQIALDMGMVCNEILVFTEFAHAILRKAQEK